MKAQQKVMTSKPHLRALRSWMTRKAVNSSRVYWGSNRNIIWYGPVTIRDMEELAESIKDAVLKEIK